MSDAVSSAPAAPAAPTADTSANNTESSNDSDNLSPDDIAALEAADSAEDSESSEPKAEARDTKKADPKDAKDSKKDEKKAEKDAKKAEKKLEAEIRKFKLKIDGKEEEVDENEVVRRAQMSTAAQKRIQEAAELKKSVMEFVTALKNDPKSILRDPNIGIDAVKLAQEILAEQLDEEQKSPEQREKEQLQKELEDLRAKTKADEEAKKQAEYERIMQESGAKLEQDVQEALETSGLPKKPIVLRRMADIMLTALDNGKPIDAKQAVKIARKELVEGYREYTQALSDDDMEEFIGQDMIKRIRKRSLAKIKAQQNQVPKASDVKDTGTKETDFYKKPAKAMTIKDWLKK